MSPRSFRRAHARRIAREQRRALLSRRRRIAAAGVLGATAIAVPQAQAAQFHVTAATDSSLRTAITNANTNSGPDEIVFDPGVTGTIRLTGGELPIQSNQGLTITGPGRSVLTVSGDANNNSTPDAGDSRIFNIALPSSTSPGPGVTISGLTLTNAFDPVGGTGGGAIFDNGSAPLTLDNVAITNSVSGDAGAGLQKSGSGALTITNSTISGNTAFNGGGLADYVTDGATRISDSTFDGNHATGNPSSHGGGISSYADTLTIERTTLSGNTATGQGGGISGQPKYRLDVNNSTVTGNAAGFGGGMALSADGIKYASARVSETTISGNQSAHGAGVGVRYITTGSRITVSRSTISGNEGGASSFGGGVLVDAFISGEFDLVDSTISGNTATAGAGASIGSDSNRPVHGTDSDGNPTGSIDFDNSTIAGNAASAHGGGIYLSQYDSGGPPVKKSGSANLTSTIVADNTANGAAQDLDRVDTSTAGGFAGAFSLVRVPGDAPMTNQSTLIGVDPQLGALGDHGGATATMLPAGTSPVIDKGRSPASLTVDQRGNPRLVDTAQPNAVNGGDGTDIGAVELAAEAVVPPPKATFTVTVRGKSISPGTPLLPASLLPLDCTVTVVQMTSCHIELRSSAATRISKKAVIPKGALLAEGTVGSKSGVSQLSLKVKLTRDGKDVLKAKPVGVDALVAAEAPTDVSSALTTTGVVHLLANQSVTLGLGKRRAKLSTTTKKRLDELAKLIPDATTVTCTAYSDKGKGDVALTKKQAKAACDRLVHDGLKAKVTSSGKGHAKPVASNKTPKGRALNRRIVITFTL